MSVSVIHSITPITRKKTLPTNRGNHTSNVTMEIRKISEVGGGVSLAIILPRGMCRDLGIEKGDYLKFELQDDNSSGKKLIITPVNMMKNVKKNK